MACMHASVCATLFHSWHGWVLVPEPNHFGTQGIERWAFVLSVCTPEVPLDGDPSISFSHHHASLANGWSTHMTVFFWAQSMRGAFWTCTIVELPPWKSTSFTLALIFLSVPRQSQNQGSWIGNTSMIDITPWTHNGTIHTQTTSCLRLAQLIGSNNSRLDLLYNDGVFSADEVEETTSRLSWTFWRTLLSEAISFPVCTNSWSIDLSVFICIIQLTMMTTSTRLAALAAVLAAALCSTTVNALSAQGIHTSKSQRQSSSSSTRLFLDIRMPSQTPMVPFKVCLVVECVCVKNEDADSPACNV